MASRFLPVNISTIDFKSGPQVIKSKLLDRIRAGEVKVATTLGELVDQEVNSHFVDVKFAANAGLIPIEAALEVGNRVFVHEFQKYCDYQSEDGEEAVRWGVGIRFVCTVTVFDLSVQINGLAALAATAQLNMTKSSVTYKTTGIHGKVISDSFPSALDTLDVTNFAKIAATVDLIKSHLFDEAVTITPNLLGVTDGRRSDIAALTPESVMQVTCLQLISRGYTLAEAKKELLVRKTPAQWMDSVEKVYRDIIKGEDVEKKPSLDEKSAATKLLLLP